MNALRKGELKMSKIKMKSVTIQAYEVNYMLNLYKKMGFELIDSQHYSGTKYCGEAIVQRIDYDYYECCFKFDMGQDKAESRWDTYQKYTQKGKQLSNKQRERSGEIIFTRAFVPVIIIMALIFFPFIPMMFGYDFGEVINWNQDLFSVDVEFDWVLLIGSVVLASLIGVIFSLIFELILYAFTFKKRRLKAVDEIRILEKELNDIIYKIQNEDF